MKEAPEAEKEVAVETEIKAARERAVVPLEARATQFRDMLLERAVLHTAMQPPHTHQARDRPSNLTHTSLNGSPPRFYLQFVSYPFAVFLSPPILPRPIPSSRFCAFLDVLFHILLEMFLVAVLFLSN